jgi:hypothetical protein
MSTTSIPNPEKVPDLEALEHLRQLAERAQRGEDVLLELRGILDACPEIWQRNGDLARLAEASWLNLVAGDDLLLRESLGRQLEALKAELAGAQPSILERLLADRVALCWLQASYADAAYAQLSGRGATPAQRAEAQQRQTSAQNRYLQAIKALATVRKLIRPVPSLFDLGLHPVAETTGVPRRRGNLSAAASAGAPVRN